MYTFISAACTQNILIDTVNYIIIVYCSLNHASSLQCQIHLAKVITGITCNSYSVQSIHTSKYMYIAWIHNVY